MAHPPQKYATVEGYKLGETALAVRFECHTVNGIRVETESGHNIQIEWFPLSQIKSLYTAIDAVEMDSIQVAEWLLQKKDLL